MADNKCKGRCVAGKYYPNPSDTYRGVGGKTYLKPVNERNKPTPRNSMGKTKR